MPTCGECKHYPWWAHRLMVYDVAGVPVHPVVPCKLQRKMLVWHDHCQPRPCIDFEPKEAEDGGES
jgi:hypothetical protein